MSVRIRIIFNTSTKKMVKSNFYKMMDLKRKFVEKKNNFKFSLVKKKERLN